MFYKSSIILPKLNGRKNSERYTLQNVELNNGSTMGHKSDSSSQQRDEQCGPPFQSILNTHPSHRTLPHMPDPIPSDAISIYWPSPLLVPGPLPTFSPNEYISDEEYADVLLACNYPGPMRDYWQQVAKSTNQYLFECAWDECLMFVLHPPSPARVALAVHAHLNDHCSKSGHCLWRGCKERKNIRAEDMCKHLMTHL